MKLQQCGVSHYRHTKEQFGFYLKKLKITVGMASLRAITFHMKHKSVNRYLCTLYKNGRHFSTKTCYTRNKVGDVKYITCQEELKIQGYRRYSNMCCTASVNVSHSQVKHISFINSTKFHGQFTTSNINVSLPVPNKIMESRSFSSGKRTSEIQKNNGDPDDRDEHDDELEDSGEDEYDDMVKRVLHLPEMGHQVLVVQPYIKWGPGKKHSTTPELQLAEAVALIGTLHKWKVVDVVSGHMNLAIMFILII